MSATTHIHVHRLLMPTVHDGPGYAPWMTLSMDAHVTIKTPARRHLDYTALHLTIEQARMLRDHLTETLAELDETELDETERAA